jgi:hypothetical protein
MLNKVLRHTTTVCWHPVGAHTKMPTTKPRPRKAPTKMIKAVGGCFDGRMLTYTEGSGYAVTMPIYMHGVCGQYMHQDGGAVWVPTL